MQVPRTALLGLGMVFGALFLGWRLHPSEAEPAPVVAAPAAFAAPAVAMASPEALAPPVPSGLPGTAYTPLAGSDQPSRELEVPMVAAPAPAARPTQARGVRPALAPALPGPGPAGTPAGGPDQVDGLSVVANGDHIVVASDGAIVSVGDNTVVKGNTGDAGASGAIGVDVNGSEVTSGDSEVSEAPASFPLQYWGTALPGTTMGGSPFPMVGAPGLPYLPGGTAPAPGTRSTSISGYENRALDVAGSDNLLTYGDSNLFFDRVGNLNGNTGDTATSGVNVVDATGSRVVSGDASTPAGSVAPPSGYGGPWLLSPFGLIPAPPTGGWSASVADGGTVATATAQDALVIGGDGVHDGGVSMLGQRNVVTDDDGIATVGGVGDVSAQVGDSETSGAVVMGVLGSDIRSGASW